MRVVALAFCVLVVLSSELPSNVKVLEQNNFDAEVKGKPTFVKFYAPWCGHCKHLAPDWIKLADMFQGSQAVIAEVNCDEEKALCSKYDVHGFPTLKLFPADPSPSAAIKYEGARTVEDLAKFVQEKTGVRARLPQHHYVEVTSESFDGVVLNPENHVLVAFYAPWCGHCQQMAPEFEKAAASFQPSDKVVFAKVDVEKYRQLGEKFDVKGFPTLKYFAAQDKTPVDYPSGREAADFVEFMNSHADSERVVGGALKAGAGRVPALEALARQFMASTAGERAGVLVQAKEKAGEVSPKSAWSAAFYVRVMETILGKGDSYVSIERARLQKILDGKSLNALKQDQFTKRLNILGDFA